LSVERTVSSANHRMQLVDDRISTGLYDSLINLV